MKISTIFQVGQYWINSLISDIAHCEVSYLKTKKKIQNKVYNYNKFWGFAIFRKKFQLMITYACRTSLELMSLNG